jgi:rhodanese-related sulfurtransferase
MRPAEVAEWLAADSEPPLMIDVREPWELAICRIEGSLSVPMGQIPAALSKLDPNRDILVICHHGIRSYQVARFLEQRGFPRVCVSLILVRKLAQTPMVTLSVHTDGRHAGMRKEDTE